MCRPVQGNLYGILSQLLTKATIRNWSPMPSHKMKRWWKKSVKSWKSEKGDQAQNPFVTIVEKVMWSSVKNQRGQRGGVLHLGTINGKETCTVRSKRKGLNCCQVHMNPDSICSLAHLSVFCSFWQFRVQTLATAMKATGGGQTIPHRTHTRALFLAAHARTPDVITRLAQGHGDLFVCVKSHFHHWSCLCLMFFRPRFFLSSHRLQPHRRHWLESDWTCARLRSGVGRLADPIPNTEDVSPYKCLGNLEIHGQSKVR